MKNLKEATKELLAIGGRYAKTDLLYLFKGSAWLSLATASSTGASLVLLYFFGNYITPEVYGEYRYFFSLYGILILTTLSGFNSVVTRATAQQKEGELLRCFKVQLLGSLVGTFASMCIALYYYVHNNETLALGFLIMGLALPLMESLDLYVAFLNGKKMFRNTAIATIISQLFTTTALCITIYFHTTALPLLTAYFASWILIKSYFFLQTKKMAQNRELSVGTYQLGFSLSFVNVLNQIANQLDRIALFQVIGAKELAQYSFAIAPTEQIKGLFKNANALIFPKFSERTEAEIKQTILHKMLLIASIAFLAAAMYALSAPFLIGWFLPKYTEIIGASQLFAFSLIGVCVIPLNVALSSIPKVKALYIINVTTPIVNIILILMLIPLYGFWGAIAAKGFGRIINTFLQYVIFMKY